MAKLRRKIPRYWRIYCGQLFGWLYCQCIRSIRFQRLINRGYEHLQGELDIVKILKRVRTSQSALYGMTDHNQRKLCKYQSLLVLKENTEKAVVHEPWSSSDSGGGSFDDL